MISNIVNEYTFDIPHYSVIKQFEFGPLHFLRLVYLSEPVGSSLRYCLLLDVPNFCNCLHCSSSDYSNFPVFFRAGDLQLAIDIYVICSNHFEA